MKVCTICKQEKTETEFYTKTSGYLYSNCKKCNQKYIESWYDRNPLKRKQMTIKTRYKLSWDEYVQRYQDQNHSCAICKQILPDPYEVKLYNTKAIHIDHDHTTKQIRGLLCFACNRGLGSFHDDINKLAEAIKYIQFYKGLQNAN